MIKIEKPGIHEPFQIDQLFINFEFPKQVINETIPKRESESFVSYDSLDKEFIEEFFENFK